MAELVQMSYIPTKADSSLKTVSGDSNGIKHQDEKSHDNPAFQGDTQNNTPTTINHYNDGEMTVDNQDDSLNMSSGWSRAIGTIQTAISSFLKKNNRVLWNIFYIVLLNAYIAYFTYAMYYRFGDEGSWRLMIVTVVCSIGLFTNIMMKYFSSKNQGSNKYDEFVAIIGRLMAKIRIQIILPILLILGFIAYVVVEIAINKPRNLVSLGGLVFFIITSYIFSHNPAKVKFRPVFWGVALQIIFAMLILRTSWGRDAFQWLGDRVTEFLAYTDSGSNFVFGKTMLTSLLSVLPVVVFFSTFVSVLYYLGVMQAIIKQLGKFLSFCLGTAPAESVNAAGNIFLGQTEAPLLIRPFLKDMTNSEIHAVMTGGFATIAGAVMAAYIIFEVPATHLLSASVMSAPAALAVSKLFYPETEKSKHSAGDVYNIAKGTERNLIEAASNGASMSIKLVANIAVNLIAFSAMLSFVNATLVWLGDRVGYNELTFQFICSYIFWPLSYLMGVDQEDCRTVAELIGSKIILNEFFAYKDLSSFIKNRKALDIYLENAGRNLTDNLTGSWSNNGTHILLYDTGDALVGGLISMRSMVITTYALCGFSNLSAMGIQLGGWEQWPPIKKASCQKLYSELWWREMLHVF